MLDLDTRSKLHQGHKKTLMFLEQMHTRSKVMIDPSQFIYDHIRNVVKTREDYTCYKNAAMSALKPSNFLSLTYIEHGVSYSEIDLGFLLDVMREMDILANERKFTFIEIVSRKEINQFITNEIGFFPKDILDEGLESIGLTWTDYIYRELIALADVKHITIDEMLGSVSMYETSPILSFIKNVILNLIVTGRYLDTAKKSQSQIFDHTTFLLNLFRESIVLNWEGVKDLTNAITNVGKTWPQESVMALGAGCGYDSLAESQFKKHLLKDM